MASQILDATAPSPTGNVIAFPITRRISLATRLADYIASAAKAPGQVQATQRPMHQLPADIAELAEAVTAHAHRLLATRGEAP